MKTCSRCKEDKNENEFYFRITENRYQPYCKPCLLTFQKNRWTQRKKDMVEYKGGKCVDCDGVFPYQAFDFHHTDPNEKDFDPAKAIRLSKETMMKEIDKCVLLCATCHRIRHIV